MLDVNEDGFGDLSADFAIRRTGFHASDEEGCIEGELEGRPFLACNVLPPLPFACGLGFELVLIIPLVIRLRRVRG
jgi:hypothetical protein